MPHFRTELDISEQMLLTLNPELFEVFMLALCEPPEPNEKLRDLMRRKPPWEPVS